MNKVHISSQEINELELKSWHGEVQVITSTSQIKGAISEILKHKVVAFDTESKPAFKKGVYNPVALLQVAIPKKVFLFRISILGFGKELASIFESKSLTKVGVAIKDDIKELQHLHSFKDENVIDLAVLADEKGIHNGGVRGLTALLLGFRISKRQQTSNWEKRQLTKAQINYAATDAWVCLNIYHELKKISQ